jgi:hypothetical protein
MGAVVDQQVLESLMKTHVQKLFEVVAKDEGGLEDFSVSSIPWFICLFAATLENEVVARIWDFMFLYGSCVLFRVGLGVLRRVEMVAVKAGSASSGDLRGFLATELKLVTVADVEEFIEYFEDTVTQKVVATLRERHRVDKVASSSCQLTVVLADGVRQEDSLVVEDYFAVSPSSLGDRRGRSSTASRRKRIVKEIDAFLGR